MSENRPQDEVVTLDALRAAAKAIPERPYSVHGAHPSTGARIDYHRARAEFWRLAWKWDRTTAHECTPKDFDEAERLMAEVEART